MSDDPVDSIGLLAGGADPKDVLKRPGVRPINDQGLYDPDREVDFWEKLRKPGDDDAASKVRNLIIKSAAEELLGMLFPDLFEEGKVVAQPAEGAYPDIDLPPIDRRLAVLRKAAEAHQEDSPFKYTRGDLLELCELVRKTVSDHIVAILAPGRPHGEGESVYHADLVAAGFQDPLRAGSHAEPDCAVPPTDGCLGALCRALEADVNAPSEHDELPATPATSDADDDVMPKF